MLAQHALPWDVPQPEALAELDTPQIELDETSLAGEYLEKYSQRRGDADTTFGKRREGKYFMGRKRVIIGNDSNLFVDGKRYKGTRGLWELIVKKEPETGVYDDDDVQNYKEIIKRTGAMIHPENPNRPAANGGHKWVTFMKPIWDEHVKKTKQKHSEKRNAKRKKHKVKAFSQAIQMPCVNVWNC